MSDYVITITDKSRAVKELLEELDKIETAQLELGAKIYAISTSQIILAKKSKVINETLKKLLINN